MVATPIGHLGDISRRGIDTLNHVGVIAAEDTRRTRVLLQHIDHKGCELVSVHEHNEERVGPVLIERMRQGTDIALVSDAGTPLINDPGYLLLQLAWQAGIRVVPIPGACSIITALSVCPIPCQPFRYVGFLSSKPKLRRTQLEALAFNVRRLGFSGKPTSDQGSADRHRGTVNASGHDWSRNDEAI